MSFRVRVKALDEWLAWYGEGGSSPNTAELIIEPASSCCGW